jgi:outer membrane lipoprotein-sorting protein
MFKTLLASLLWLGIGLAGATETAAEWLQKADSFRLPEEQVRIETEVEVYRGDSLDKARHYRVYLKPGHRALVTMQSPLEAGQKLLMLGDQFWMFLPESQRPLRITASQKLLGEAAVGDVATLTWSEDYTGVVVGEREVAGKPCLLLDLQATRPATYSRVELYLDRRAGFPVKADLYVGSGKRAKEAWYLLQSRQGRRLVVGMTLLDALQPGKRTEVRYLDFARHELGDEVYNPAALLRRSVP